MGEESTPANEEKREHSPTNEPYFVDIEGLRVNFSSMVAATMALVIVWAAERDRPEMQPHADEWAKMILQKYPRPVPEWHHWAMAMLKDLKWWEAKVPGEAARRLWNGTPPVYSREESM